MIDVHYWPTPNGKKVTIQLEESGIDYNVVYCSIGTGGQFEKQFLDISPNNRMPAIVDQQPSDGGAPLSVFESGACMLYLAEKTNQFGGRNEREKWEVVQWVMWQMANQGPKSGERGHFARLGDDQGDQSYACRRFDDEVHRLYGVMNNRLYDRPALQRGMAVGSDLTQDYSKLSDEDKTRIRALLYNQRARPAPETGGIE